MDATNPSALPTWANRTPLHIGGVGLNVRDLDRVTEYYRRLLGFEMIAQSKDTVRLGAGDMPFFELNRRPGLKPDDARTAGLYHTAFLMPTRGDLARWLTHVARTRVPITGASDHHVSEAIYLDDPEANGIEVYADRPADRWAWAGERIRMTTERLDLDDLAAAADGAAYDRAPAGLRIGHVHLRVGDVVDAQRFYGDIVGLTVTSARHGAAFLSTGGYHHHLGSNVWHSAGAGQRDDGLAGLAWFSLETADDATFSAVRGRLERAGVPLTAAEYGFETRDPWGTRLRIVKP